MEARNKGWCLPTLALLCASGLIGVLLAVVVGVGCGELYDIQKQVDNWRGELAQLGSFYNNKLERLALSANKAANNDNENKNNNSELVREAELIESVKFALENLAYEASERIFVDEFAAGKLEAQFQVSRVNWAQYLLARLRLRAHTEASKFVDQQDAAIYRLIDRLAGGGGSSSASLFSPTGAASQLVADVLVLRKLWLAHGAELNRDQQEALSVAGLAPNRQLQALFVQQVDQLIDNQFGCNGCKDMYWPGQMYDAPQLYSDNEQRAKLGELLEGAADANGPSGGSSELRTIKLKLDEMLKQIGLY